MKNWVMLWITLILACSIATSANIVKRSAQYSEADIAFLQKLIRNQEVQDFIERRRRLEEQCRRQACFEVFKSHSICNGSGSFYIWAKQVAVKVQNEAICEVITPTQDIIIENIN